MDDFNLGSLYESRNEWISRLITIITPCVFKGIKAIFDESMKASCVENQKSKYLMTFQNLLIQVPKWNNDMINNEVERITNESKCTYIEDLITCVHIIQLKALTCVRVGSNEKNVNINIPKLHDFIHRVYINSARAIYSNIYLFEQDILPLEIQKNYNKVDMLIKQSIIESVRQSMPIDEILRSYLEDTVELTPEKAESSEGSQMTSETETIIGNKNTVLQTDTQNETSNTINIEANVNDFNINTEPDNLSSNIELSHTSDYDQAIISKTPELEAPAPSLIESPSLSISEVNLDSKTDVERVSFDLPEEDDDIFTFADSEVDQSSVNNLLGVEILE
jgi:hypothetical protein